MIRVVHVRTGNAMVLDPEPADGGNVLLDGNERAWVYGSGSAALEARQLDIVDGGRLGLTGMPHFDHHATCPPLAEKAARAREARMAAERDRAERDRIARGGEQMGLGL